MTNVDIMQLVLTVKLRTQPDEIGLEPHTPSTCAAKHNQLSVFVLRLVNSTDIVTTLWLQMGAGAL